MEVQSTVRTFTRSLNKALPCRLHAFTMVFARKERSHSDLYVLLRDSVDTKCSEVFPQISKNRIFQKIEAGENTIFQVSRSASCSLPTSYNLQNKPDTPPKKHPEVVAAKIPSTQGTAMRFFRTTEIPTMLTAKPVKLKKFMLAKLKESTETKTYRIQPIQLS